MATSYTSLLGLALPVTGELQGTWGTVVNDSITSLLDTAVAGTTTLTSDSDVTLSTTTGVANQARQMVVLWTANGTVTRYITAPAQSKVYVVINATAGTQSIVLRGVGPTTGVTVAAGEKKFVAWNGTDFVEVGGGGAVGLIGPADGGTGVANNVANTLAFTGNYSLGLTLSANTSLTLPTTGTLATLAGSEALTSKTINVDNNTLSGLAALSFVLSDSSGNIDGAAAQKAIPTGVVVGSSDTQTLTNKRITQRVSSTASISSPLAWNSDNFDQYAATAQTTALTINADAGTPTDGQKIVFRFKDDGSARTLSWTTGVSNSFQAVGVTLPTTTVAGKVTYVGAIYNASAARWDVVATVTQA